MFNGLTPPAASSTRFTACASSPVEGQEAARVVAVLLSTRIGALRHTHSRTFLAEIPRRVQSWQHGVEVRAHLLHAQLLVLEGAWPTSSSQSSWKLTLLRPLTRWRGVSTPS